MSEVIRVKCNVCTNVEGNVCVIKNIKVSINKKRLCEYFNFDEAKASAILTKKVIAESIPSEMRPDWTYDKNMRRKIRSEIRKEVERVEALASRRQAESAPVDFTKPDCLANIRSSVSNDS